MGDFLLYVHFWVPSGLIAYSKLSPAETYMVSSLPIAGAVTIEPSWLVGNSRFRVPSGFIASVMKISFKQNQPQLLMDYA